MTNAELELAELREQFDDFTLRYSALEFIVEQILANQIIDDPDAEAFLDQIKGRGGVWTQRQGIVESPPADATAALTAHLAAIVEKVRVRIRQGRRRV